MTANNDDDDRRTRRRTRPAGIALALMSGSAMMAACSTPYLHDAAIETQTATIKEAYGGINSNSYFTEARAAFATLQAQEDAALSGSLLAMRDRHLTSAIHPTDLDAFAGQLGIESDDEVDKPEASPKKYEVDPKLVPLLRCIPEVAKGPVATRGPQIVCRQSLERLHEILGACPEGTQLSPAQAEWSTNPDKRTSADMEGICADRLGSDNLNSWSELPTFIRGRRSRIVRAENRVATELKLFLAERAAWQAEREKTKREKEKQQPRRANSGAKPRKGQKGQERGTAPAQPQIKLSCDDLLARPDPVSKENLPEYTDKLIEGLKKIQEACGALRTARADLRPGGMLYRRLTPMVAGSRVVLGDDGKILPAGGARPLLVRLEEEAGQARKDRADAKAEAEIVAAAIEALQKQIKDKESVGWQLDQRVSDLKKALADAPAVASLVGAEGLAKLLEDMLKAELQSASVAVGTVAAPDEGGAEEKSAVTSKTEAVLSAVAALQSVDEAIRLGDANQRVSALLLAVAAERQKADMAALKQQRETERLAIIESQELTLLTEVALLSEALAYAYGEGLISEPKGIVAMTGSPRARATSALNRYALSWSEGRVPFQLLEQRKTYINREYRLRMAERTAANWQSLIQPAVAQLSAAGSGGIKPEVIAGILGRLGIGSAILED
jgi:hypothetical protein